MVQFADGSVERHRADHPAWIEIRAGLKELEKNVREIEPLLARARAAKDPATLREAMSAVATHRSYAALVPVLELWCQDTRAVLDQLGALPAPLGAIVDPGQVGLFGHSLGGMVAGQLAMTDGRVRAGMNYDGAQLPPQKDVPYALKVPFCFLYADASKVGATTVSTAGMNDALLTAGGFGAVLRGATHLNFTDMNNLSMMARTLGSIDRGEMARVLRGTTLGFFDHHLKRLPTSALKPSDCLEVSTLKPEAT
jgi:pimeloyl-ACP methyl ester carboxylesterase